ncbi:MAG: sulfite exporter TauE/SafE family protein [Planctomycetota bacterium]
MRATGNSFEQEHLPRWRRRARTYAPFLLWVAIALTAWLAILGIGWGRFGLTLWSDAAEHWVLALAMALGSYIAGSTPMGGGTVGFPVLVLAFGEPADLGRHFSMCIQAVGMTSAAIFICCGRKPVEWRLLLIAIGAALPVIPVASVWLVPLVSDPLVKLVFAVTWGGFGLMTLFRAHALLKEHDRTRFGLRLDLPVGVAVGVSGGISTALTGVGIDMLIFVALVLVYRRDVRDAVATSVIAMAACSLIGVVSVTWLGRLDTEVFHRWLAAAPVVLFGAPLGALAVHLLPRLGTMIFVGALCLVQLVWALVNIDADPRTIAVVVLAVLAMNAAFIALHRLGGKLHALEPS